MPIKLIYKNSFIWEGQDRKWFISMPMALIVIVNALLTHFRHLWIKHLWKSDILLVKTNYLVSI